jgi:undecaprenyl-diphosphatase
MSDLGNVQIAIPVIVLTAGYTAWRGSAARVRRWWLPPVAALLLMTLVPLIVIPLKAWTDRVGTPTVPPATGYYPSGHTATAVVAYGAAALLLLPWLLTDLARRAVLATAAVLVAAASFGLVRRGYHWPLDVVASWCLGALLLGALWLTLRRIARGATAPIRHTPAHHHYDSDKRPPARPPLPWTRKPTHTPNAEGPGTRS